MARMTHPLTPQDFVAKWRASTLKERSAAQEHFIDLCRLLGHPTPTEADPTGASFTFEAGVAKQKGGQGWADVWKFAGSMTRIIPDTEGAYRIRWARRSCARISCGRLWHQAQWAEGWRPGRIERGAIVFDIEATWL